MHVPLVVEWQVPSASFESNTIEQGGRAGAAHVERAARQRPSEFESTRRAATEPIGFGVQVINLPPHTGSIRSRCGWNLPATPTRSGHGSPMPGHHGRDAGAGATGSRLKSEDRRTAGKGLCGAPEALAEGGAADESGCTPGSVARSPRGGRGDGHPSRTGIAAGLVRSTRELGRAALGRSRRSTGVLPLDLAPGGVYLAVRVASDAGGLLHHRFTLTGDRGPRRSVFCGTVPRVTPGGR